MQVLTRVTDVIPPNNRPKEKDPLEMLRTSFILPTLCLFLIVILNFLFLKNRLVVGVALTLFIRVSSNYRSSKDLTL
jgi:hypothetical protein